MKSWPKMKLGKVISAPIFGYYSYFGPDLALFIYIFQYLALFTYIYQHLPYYIYP